MKCPDSALCLLSSGVFAGLGTAITVVFVPALKETSDPLPAWKRLYKNGGKVALSMIFTTSALAVKLFMKTDDSRYLLVAGTTFIIAPYTMLVMMKTNNELMSIKDTKYREDEEEESRVRRLISKWNKLQYARTALGLLGFAINVWIVCKKMKS